MRLNWLGVLIAAGCAPVARAPGSAPPPRWVTIETDAAHLDYPAGDGSVSNSARVLVLVPAPRESRGRRPPPTIELPARVEVGEIFHLEIRVARAEAADVRTFRIRCRRPGLRLLDPDTVVIVGRRSAVCRAIADSAGPATFDLEDLTD
jgi:hypothetical protein